MSNILLKTAIRTLFTFSSRDKALQQTEAILKRYTTLAMGLSKEAGQTCIEVPSMRGVDEDMRNWSFFMVLEHNAIVNRSITATVTQLARGEVLSGSATIDQKKDVMPSLSADESQIDAFADSVAEHIAAVKDLKRLRGTRTSPHTVFGNFDAHKWNCMFAFHLALHFSQAKYVVEKIRTEKGSGPSTL